MDDVRGSFSEPANGTTPAAVKPNKNQKWVKSNDDINGMKSCQTALSDIES